MRLCQTKSQEIQQYFRFNLFAKIFLIFFNFPMDNAGVKPYTPPHRAAGALQLQAGAELKQDIRTSVGRTIWWLAYCCLDLLFDKFGYERDTRLVGLSIVFV